MDKVTLDNVFALCRAGIGLAHDSINGLLSHDEGVDYWRGQIDALGALVDVLRSWEGD